MFYLQISKMHHGISGDLNSDNDIDNKSNNNNKLITKHES